MSAFKYYYTSEESSEEFYRAQDAENYLYQMMEAQLVEFHSEVIEEIERSGLSVEEFSKEEMMTIATYCDDPYGRWSVRNGLQKVMDDKVSREATAPQVTPFEDDMPF